MRYAHSMEFGLLLQLRPMRVLSDIVLYKWSVKCFAVSNEGGFPFPLQGIVAVRWFQIRKVVITVVHQERETGIDVIL